MVMAFYTGKTKNNFLSNQAMKYIQIKKTKNPLNVLFNQKTILITKLPCNLGSMETNRTQI